MCESHGPKMHVIVSGGCTEVFANGELVAYLIHENEDEGFKIAKRYKAKKAFLADMSYPDHISILVEPKPKTTLWQRFIKWSRS